MFLRALLMTTALVLTGPAIAQDNATPPGEAVTPAAVMNASEFATKVAVSNKFEISSSELAIEKTGNEAVKTFADQMVADHLKAGENFATAAASEGITPPDTLDQQHQSILDRLSGLEGEEFDTAYIKAQQDAHDEAVALFESYSTEGAEGALKEFARTTLPTLQKHQEDVHGLAGH
jgi:putative membrane protein